jgi:hypothetical protein
MRLARHAALVVEMRNTHGILGGKLLGKRPVGRTRRRCKEYVKMKRREQDSTGSGESPLTDFVITVMNIFLSINATTNSLKKMPNLGN